MQELLKNSYYLKLARYLLDISSWNCYRKLSYMAILHKSKMEHSETWNYQPNHY